MCETQKRENLDADSIVSLLKVVFKWLARTEMSYVSQNTKTAGTAMCPASQTPVNFMLQRKRHCPSWDAPVASQEARNSASIKHAKSFDSKTYACYLSLRITSPLPHKGPFSSLPPPSFSVCEWRSPRHSPQTEDQCILTTSFTVLQTLYLFC